MHIHHKYKTYLAWGLRILGIKTPQTPRPNFRGGPNPCNFTYGYVYKYRPLIELRL